MARILIIEDDASVRKLLVTFLGRAGYVVEEATDGREGIHKNTNTPADLIITDLIMPGKEGLETIVELRSEFPELKIIAISGGIASSDENYLNAAELCGASKVFSKPFDNKKLLEAVEVLLNEGQK